MYFGASGSIKEKYIPVPFLNKGITLEHFHSSGNTPVEMEQLKIKGVRNEISAFTQESSRDLSRPVALDLLILNNNEKTLELFVDSN